MKIKITKKRRNLLIAAVIIIGVGIWMATRWHAWFGLPPEPPYTIPNEPCRILLTMGNEDELSRNIGWQCGDSVQQSWVELMDADSLITRIDAQGEVYQSRSGKGAFYVARLRNLKYAQHYQYRVATGGKFSEWHAFSTQGKNDELNLMYVGDVQDTLSGETNSVLRRAMQLNPKTQMLICGGDLVERPSDNYWQEGFDGLDSIRQAMPILACTGNHDYMKSLPDTVEHRFSLVFCYFLDSHVDRNHLYTFKMGNAQLFFLDSTRNLFCIWSQRQWLKEQLEKSTAKWKILVTHHPLYSIKGTMNQMIDRWMLAGMIQEMGIDLVLQGHEHAYARMTEEEDGEKVPPLYTVSHCSPKTYRIKFDDDRYDKYGVYCRFYQTVYTQGDTLNMCTYEADNYTLYDHVQIVKHPSQKPQIIDLGKNIPEKLEFKGDENNKKDREFKERIEEYKAKK